jgi:hypothetical protein
MAETELASLHGVPIAEDEAEAQVVAAEILRNYTREVVGRTMEALDLTPSSTGWHNARFAAEKAAELVIGDLQSFENQQQTDTPNEGAN